MSRGKQAPAATAPPASASGPEGEQMIFKGAAKKRQKISTVETALFSIDVFCHLATFLEPSELCQLRVTCKALGSEEHVALDGLCMAEEAARRIFEQSECGEANALLPRNDDEGWIELCHHLQMSRSPLTFDQLVGIYVKYGDNDKAVVQWKPGGASSAICGNHIMRTGKHWATFQVREEELGGYLPFGVIRPLPGWGRRRLREFQPANPRFRDDLRRERTSRWEGDVHFCLFYQTGECWYSDWEGVTNRRSNQEGFNLNSSYDRRMETFGMLLDLDSGRLSVYKNGRRLGTLKDGLAGVYCWIACLAGRGGVSIERGYL